MIVEESCVWDSTFRTTVDAWRRLGAPWMSSCYDFTPRRRCWPETRRSTSNTKGKKVPFQWLGYLRFNRVVFDHHNKFQGFWPMTFSLNISATFWCPMQWLNDYGQVLGDANNFVLSFTTVVHRQVFVSIEVLPFFVPCFDIEVLDVLPWICWALFDRYFVCLCDLVVYQPWGVGDGMNVSLFCMK